jgi:tetratricopeptide (TPR) repeat protein
MKWPLASILIAMLPITLLAQEHEHGDHAAPAPYGTVNFATSCSPAIKDDFNRAVAMLHSFEYDTARAAFLKIAEKEPSCAIAHWGAAMTYFHGAWGEVDSENGAKEATKGRELATSNPTTTVREKAYIEAVSAIYSEPNASVYERAKKFAPAMEKVHQAYPDDDEAAIFYAVALYDSAGSDKSYANQRKCGKILEPLFKKLPNHPGIAHYLIHCYDNPVLAQQGLSAAREYAMIAPDSAHATHMPSHIFVRLGLWQDVIDSNVQSIKVAERGAAPCHERGSELHAMHFLQFAYLQLGHEEDAKKVVEKALSLPTDDGCESGAYIAGSYALDAHDWEMANKFDLQKFANQPNPPDILLTAIGVAAARGGNLVRAQQAEHTLAKVKDESAQGWNWRRHECFELGGGRVDSSGPA